MKSPRKSKISQMLLIIRINNRMYVYKDYTVYVDARNATATVVVYLYFPHKNNNHLSVTLGVRLEVHKGV
jgi:hypothetical protein